MGQNLKSARLAGVFPASGTPEVDLGNKCSNSFLLILYILKYYSITTVGPHPVRQAQVLLGFSLLYFIGKSVLHV